jgi:hypothetical protein
MVFINGMLTTLERQSTHTEIPVLDNDYCRV